MSNSEPLAFKLDRDKRDVTIDGDSYVLEELDGRDRDKYLTDLGGRLRVGPDGKPAGVKDFTNLQAYLVSLSLKKMESGKLVPVALLTIQSWPAKVVAGLFDAARELSQLGKEEGEDTPKGND